MRKLILLLIWVFLHNPEETAAQIITTIAGNGTLGYSGDGGPATDASLRIVNAVMPDGLGNIYISDAGNNRIRKVDVAGIITTVAGSTIIGGFGGDGGPATDAKLWFPYFLAMDKKGNLFFSDNSNRRVRKIDAAGTITTFAGNGLVYSGDGGPATAAGFGTGPWGLCFDAIGNLYIATGNRIRKVDTFGIITTYAGTGTPGNTGDNGPATAANISLVGQIELDAASNMYISTTSSSGGRIRKISASGIITTFAGVGTNGYGGDGGPATAAQLNNAGALFPDKCGNVYIADGGNNRIRMVNSHGNIHSVAGTGTVGYSGNGGPALAATFNGMGGLYIDKNSNIYVADGNNYCVRYIKMDSCHSVLDVPTVIAGNAATVFPNPVNDELHLQTGQSNYSSFIIRNCVGQEMMRQKISSPETNINMQLLPAGVYYISLQGDNGIQIQRFMKM